MEGFEIDIPTKRYIKRFLEKNYGKDEKPPAELTRRDRYGNLIFILLEKSSHKEDRDFPSYKELVRVRMTSNYYVIKSKDLTKTSVMYLNNILEADIKNLLRSYIRGMQSTSEKSLRSMMESALDHFGFSDMDFPVETLKKDLDRKGLDLID